MFCLDEYLERIQYLPLEVNRNLRLIQELDRRAMLARDFMKQCQEELITSLQTSGALPAGGGGTTSKKAITFNDSQREVIARLDKAQTEYFHLSDEKSKIAEQIYDEISFQHSELQNEAKRFCPPPSNEVPATSSLNHHEETTSHAHSTSARGNVATDSTSAAATSGKAGNAAAGTGILIKKKKKLKKLEEKKSVNKSTSEKNAGGNSSPARLSDSQVSLQNNNNNNTLHHSSYANEYSHNSSLHVPQAQNPIEGPNKTSKRHSKSKYATSNRQTYQCCGSQQDGSIVQCSSCESWFHNVCVDLDMDSTPQFWFCKRCKHNQITASNSVANPPPTASAENSQSLEKVGSINFQQNQSQNTHPVSATSSVKKTGKSD